MHISQIQITSRADQGSHIWRFRPGHGRFQMAAVLAETPERQNILVQGLIYGLLGRKQPSIDSVRLEFVDNSGESWGLWREVGSCQFFYNERSISIEQAQKSMLAAVLDMEVSLLSEEGLIISLVHSRIESHEGQLIARDLLEERSVPGKFEPEVVSKYIAEECARVLDNPAFNNPEKLASVAERLAQLMGRWSEAATLPAASASAKELSPSLTMVETLVKELDHLQQIDFLSKKMGDNQDHTGRLTSHVAGIDERLSAIANRWPPESLDLAANTGTWMTGLDLLIKVRSYSKLAETTKRIRKIVQERLKPVADASTKAWDDFLRGSQSTGQELESCLATTLLGMKKLSQDVEKIFEALPLEEPLYQPSKPAAGWFDRLRGHHPLRDPSSQSTQEPSASSQHRQWIINSGHLIEGIKESLDYALKSVQDFSDKSDEGKSQVQRSLESLEELAQKSGTELVKLTDQWTQWAQAHHLAPDTSIESLAQLVLDATEQHMLIEQRSFLLSRIDERLALQSQLEGFIRHWWNAIGSDKDVDLKNPAFLVAEARAALRHRETRRQRVQKIVKDAARSARDESLLLWAKKRRTELQQAWNEVFLTAGLPVVEITDERAQSLLRFCSSLHALKQLQVAERENRSASQGDLWNADSEARLRIYSLDTQNFSQIENDMLWERLSGSPLWDQSWVGIFLSQDNALVDFLASRGFGTGKALAKAESPSPFEPVKAETSKPRRSLEGGTHRETVKGKLSGSSSLAEKKPPERSQRPAGSATPVLSAKAEAALKILNPKPR